MPIEKYMIKFPSGEPFHLGCGKTFIVLEIGINHNGNMMLAKDLITAVANAGADAVKFQKRDVDTFVAGRRDAPCESMWGTTVYDKYKGREFTTEQCKELFNFATDKGLFCFWSYWDIESLFQMMKSGLLKHTAAIKIPSAKATDMTLLNDAAIYSEMYHIPVFLGTGMCTEDDLFVAMDQLDESSLVVPMQCTSSYPCKPQDIHLNTMKRMKLLKDKIAGYSGHEDGFYPTLGAVGAGAVIVERHITLDKTLYGTDQSMSLNPLECNEMVKAIRIVDQAKGETHKQVLECEQESVIRLKDITCRKKLLE